MIHREVDTLFQLGIVARTSDGQLLERFTNRQAGAREAAFEELVRRHGSMVLGVCYRALGNSHAAEDAFQATFLILALRAHSVRRRESIGSWLHGVAARVARRARVVEHRRRETALPEQGLPGPGAADPEQGESWSILDAELDRLPEKYRRPVVLCYLEGKTQDEAATTLGWSKGTVSGRLARAKDLLRSRLTRRGLAPAAALAAWSLPEAKAAAVPRSLLLGAVRAASAASLVGMETSVVSGQTMALARGVLGAMLVGRLKIIVTLLLLGCGAVAMAAPFLRDTRPFGLPQLKRPNVLRGAQNTRSMRTDWIVGGGFTPDGKSAISARADGVVQFWDPATGQPVRALTLLEHREGVLRGFAVSPDGTRLAGVGSTRENSQQGEKGAVWIWNSEKGELVRQISVDSAGLECLSFSPEGASLATGGPLGMIQLWDVSTGEELLTLRLGGGVIRWLAYAPDGMTLAASDEASGLQLWSLAEGRALGALAEGSPQGPLCPTFSRDGRLVAFGTTAGEVIVWDRSARRPQTRTLFGWQDKPALAFSPDSQSLAVGGGLEGGLTVINTATGQKQWSVNLGAEGGSVSLAYGPDGKTILSGRGSRLEFFDAESGRLIPQLSDGEVVR